VITAAYVTYATLLATIVTSSILVPHIFLLSKSLLSTTTTTNTSLGYCYNGGNSTLTPFLGGNDYELNESLEFEMDPETTEMDMKMNFSGNLGNFLLQDIPLGQQQRFTNPGSAGMTTYSLPMPPPPPLAKRQRRQKEFGRQFKNLMKLLHSDGKATCHRNAFGLREMCSRGIIMKV